MTKEFSAQASKRGIQRVAVLPFSAPDGSSHSRGRFISERLATYLARSGKVDVVERAMMKEIMQEHFLGQTGLLEQEHLARVGRMLQAEAVIVGSFVFLGNRAEINARLVDVETGAILGVSEARVKGEWLVALDSLFPSPSPITAEEAMREVFAYRRNGEVPPQPAIGISRKSTSFSNFREEIDTSVAESCENASARVDALEESVLALKARYWGQRLKKGKASIESAQAAGAIVSNPELRRKYHKLLKLAAIQPEALSLMEIARFVTADGQAFALHQKCAASVGYIAKQ